MLTTFGEQELCALEGSMLATNRYEAIRLMITSDMIALSAVGDSRLRRDSPMQQSQDQSVRRYAILFLHSDVNDCTLKLEYSRVILRQLFVSKPNWVKLHLWQKPTTADLQSCQR